MTHIKPLPTAAKDTANDTASVDVAVGTGMNAAAPGENAVLYVATHVARGHGPDAADDTDGNTNRDVDCDTDGARDVGAGEEGGDTPFLLAMNRLAVARATTAAAAAPRRRARARSQAPDRSGLGYLFPGLAVGQPRFTGRGTSDLGRLTHILVQSHARTAQGGASADVLIGGLYAIAYDLIDANPNARRVLATEAVGLAMAYFNHFLPDRNWFLAGTEWRVAGGRVDLVWEHVASREVLFDEVKTSRVTNGRQVQPAWLAQARRYSTAGVEDFGAAFQGTRLVLLNAPDQARLIAPDLSVARLRPTPAEPARCEDGSTVLARPGGGA
ncbi:hypothetical protein [Nocardioides abyssi]|uniref:PD-(D/E)XK nuclease superfamily protein n=1 Tax=Nocardioides abyssi TaxID=3058370 RepID=A0ABT8ESJ2_9ACTN|nr:hypothetical protein [Nocardioides abyssi]MDN4161127.1 hypothetical protein [Nocardioides abyssi]